MIRKNPKCIVLETLKHVLSTYLFIICFFIYLKKIILDFMTAESFLVIIAPLILFVFGVLLIPKIVNPKKI